MRREREAAAVVQVEALALVLVLLRLLVEQVLGLEQAPAQLVAA